MKALTLDDRPVVADAVVSRELDDETILLNLDTGIYFGLDAVGSDMWRAMQSSASLADAVRVIQAQYDADPAVLRDDLLGLANQMLAKGLVRHAGTTASGT